MPIMPPSTTATRGIKDDAEKEADAKLPVPEISRELIAWLRATNPIRPISPTETLAEANRKAGCQDLIDKLDILSHLQEKDRQGELDEDDKDLLIWEQPTSDEVNGYVLRIS